MRTRTRWLLAFVALVVTVVVAVVVPLPSPLELRDWARAAGPLAPVLFLVTHALVTTTPLPRTAFTLSAGLMFGPWWGVTLCVVASTLSALAGFAISRRIGGRAIERLGPGRVRMLEERLSERGLLTVTSARLVPALPFAPLNYTLGVTSVRWWPYFLGTLVGLVPNTTVIVLLGNLATGGTSPTMVIVFLVSGAVGVLGMLLSARGWREATARAAAAEEAERGDDAGEPGAGRPAA